MNIKRMDIAEFRDLGFLQEANRQFFHPLGLALEVIQEEGKPDRLGGVWDYRDDKEGIIYDIAHLSVEEQTKMKQKADNVQDEFHKHAAHRKQLMGGYTTEPIPRIPFSKHPDQ